MDYDNAVREAPRGGAIGVTKATFTMETERELSSLGETLGEALADLSMLNDRLFGPTADAGRAGNTAAPQPPGAAAGISVLIEGRRLQAAQINSLARLLNSRI